MPAEPHYPLSFQKSLFPFDWFRVLIVLADITHQFAIQILYRCEDAAGDHITLNA